MKKRIFTLLPTLILCLVLLPATAAAAGEHGGHDDGTWTELTQSNFDQDLTLSDGNHYYLSGDVTVSSAITVTGTVTLCLNGHVLDLNETHISVGSGANLTLCDCTDVITYGNIGSDGRWEKADASGTCNLTGGVITGGYNNMGGGVKVASGGTFTMTGGNIAGNRAGLGGGVCVDGGTFTMTDGSITGNSADQSGGGVYVDSGTFTMEGGTINHNSAGSYAGGVYVKGGTFTMRGGTINHNSVYSYAGGVYVKGGTFTMKGGSISHNTANRVGGVFVDSDGTFTMKGGSIHHNSAPHNTGGGVYVYGTFTMENGSITDNTAYSGGGVLVYGTFTMRGGSITGNSTYYSAGGVYVGSGSTFTMEGGTITGNKASDTYGGYGGGVYVDSGTFTMEGGTITGNTANKGGGVYVNYGTFTLSGSPTIQDNTLTGTGTPSSVYLDGDKKITIGEKGLANGTPIGVSMETTGTFTSGWSEDMGDPAEYFTSDNAAYGVTLSESGEAKLAPQYTVTFDANGGSPTSAQTVVEGETASRPATDPAKDGFLFLGWYTDEACTQYYDFTAPVTEDLILYAGWVFMPPFSGYSISVPAADHGKVTVSPTTTAASGTTVTVTAAPDGGYELASLTVATASGDPQTLTSLGSGKFTFTMPSSSVTVTAVFQAEAPAAPTEPTAPAGWVNPYTDVAVSDWFYNAVGYASANGLMSGTSATTFSPNSPMSRCMVWTVIARLAGQDISGASWAADAKAWAMAAGVSDGTNPDGTISREEIVTMLYRYAGSPAVSTSELGLLGQYPDGGGVSDWAQSAMAWAVSAGIIEGRDGRLASGEALTRAEAATILGRVHLMMGK